MILFVDVTGNDVNPVEVVFVRLMVDKGYDEVATCLVISFINQVSFKD